MHCNDTCCNPRLDVPEFLLLSTRTHRARQEHTCSECRKPILPGTVYVRTAYLLDGDFYTDKEHTPCASGH